MKRKPDLPIPIWLYVLSPLLLAMMRGSRRARFAERCRATRIKLDKREQLQREERLYAKEAALYKQLLTNRLAGLGYMWAARYRYDTGPQEGQGSRRKRKKTQKVQFEKGRIFTKPEVFYYKIKVRKKGLFGTKNALPYGVKVLDLISEETTKELSYATERVVTSSYDDARSGVWYLVHRLEGHTLIPVKVSFGEMLLHYPPDIYDIPWVLGMGAHKRVKSLSLARNPHLLIAGPTGTGKSNALNSFLLGLMYYSTPQQIQLCLIDLKEGVEFDIYRDCPHLQRPIVERPEEALNALREMSNEIDRRLRLLREAGAKDLSDYNRLHPAAPLPILITVIDEYAQLVLPVDKKVRDEANRLVVRISALGRAPGIQIVVCTQYPTKEVIDPQIKINLNLKMSFRTQNATQSMVIINDPRAASLPDVKGRALYALGPDVFEAQIAHVTGDDIRHVLRVAKGRTAGLTKLDGAAIEINTAGVIKLIAAAGKMSKTELIKSLRSYALEESQVLEFWEKLPSEAVIEGKNYRIGKRPNMIMVREDVPLTPVIPEPAPDPEDTPIIPLGPVPQNEIDHYLNDCVVPGAGVVAMAMYMHYQNWAEAQGIEPMKPEELVQALESKGLRRNKETRKWEGVGLGNITTADLPR